MRSIGPMRNERFARSWLYWSIALAAAMLLAGGCSQGAETPVVPEVSITAETSVLAAGEDVVFTITADPAPRQDLTVGVAVTTMDVTLSESPPEHVTIRAGAPAATLTLTVATVEKSPDAALSVSVTAGSGYKVSEASSSTGVRQLPEVSITADTSILAAGEDVVFTITADLAPRQDLTIGVAVTTMDVTLSESPPGHIMIRAGVSATTLTLTVATVESPDAALSVAVAMGSGYEVSKASASASVHPLPEITISATTTRVEEGTEATFTLNRTGITTAALTVSVTISETGNMIEGVVPTEVMFDKGEAASMLSVATSDDSSHERDSTVTAMVSPGAGYAVGASDSASISVTDDDPAPPRRIRTEVWSTMLTPGQVSGGPTGYCGNNGSSQCHVKSSHAPYGSLGDDDFVIGGVTYTALSLRHGGATGGNDRLHITVDKALSGNLTLHVGNESFAWSTATNPKPSIDHNYGWTVDPAPWTVGTAVSVRLVLVQ